MQPTAESFRKSAAILMQLLEQAATELDSVTSSSPSSELKRLCTFYGVATVEELALAQSAHVERLQSIVSSPKELALARLRQSAEEIRSTLPSRQS